jgi:hypothetical protein
MYCMYLCVFLDQYILDTYKYIQDSQIHRYALWGFDMYKICTVHICMYFFQKYIQYIHAIFNTYRYAHAGPLMGRNSAAWVPPPETLVVWSGMLWRSCPVAQYAPDLGCYLRAVDRLHLSRQPGQVRLA